MLPTLNLGPVVLPTATLIYIAGIWLALLAVEKAAGRLKLHVPWTYNVAAIALAAGFIGAKVVFVATHWDAYRQNLLGIIWPLTSGYNLWAGLFAAFWAAFFYGRARGLPPGSTLDALAPGLLAGAMTISLADFLAGPGYGTESQMPWSIVLFGISRHPVQLYEIAVALLALLTWLLYLKRRDYEGQLFLLATAVFSAGRLLVDAYRANAVLTTGGYHMLQIGALAVLVVAMVFLMRAATRVDTEAQPEEA